MIGQLVFAALCDLFRLIDAVARGLDLIAIYFAQFTTPRGAG